MPPFGPVSRMMIGEFTAEALRTQRRKRPGVDGEAAGLGVAVGSVVDSKWNRMESKQPVTKADLEGLKADLVEAMHGMLHETETKLLTALNASADLLTQ